jgi:thioesterase domain-containing protein
MSDVTPETSLEIHLRRISKVVKSWPGDPLDEWGSLRILNAGGTKPPIFWCFNSAGEFPALAEALGADQPIVGLRSLNQILEPTAISSRHTRELGEYYADQLFDKFGTAKCIVGGNCQAASISYALALSIKSRDTDVLCLITLDATLRRPYPGEMRMLFGRNSHRQNPFFEKTIDLNAAPALDWRHAISSIKIGIVDGGHGAYFLAENVESLAREISAPVVPVDRGKAVSRLPLWNVVEENEEYLTVGTPKATCEVDDFAIIAIWEQNGEVLRSLGDDWIAYPKAKGNNFQCKLKKPADQGDFILRLVVCVRDVGPRAWPIAEFQTITVANRHQNNRCWKKSAARSHFICALKNVVRKIL